MYKRLRGGSPALGAAASRRAKFRGRLFIERRRVEPRRGGARGSAGGRGEVRVSRLEDMDFAVPRRHGLPAPRGFRDGGARGEWPRRDRAIVLDEDVWVGPRIEI